MSKYLIIYANPSHNGHGGYMLQNLENKLKKNNSTYDLIDLYKINYDPILQNEEIKQNNQVVIKEDTKKHQTQIQEAEKLIFIYPVWWQNMPAILKGFLDRTFVGGFGFKYVNGLPIALLKNKKAAVFCTAASPIIYNSIFNRKIATRILSKEILNFCGIKTKSFMLGGSRKLEKNKEKIEKIANNIISYLS